LGSSPPVLEILQLVKKRDFLLADTHILELEHECNDRGTAPPPEDAAGGRRKAKDVELLYEELQKELWAVVRESLRSPTAGPNLGLVVQVRTGGGSPGPGGAGEDRGGSPAGSRGDAFMAFR